MNIAPSFLIMNNKVTALSKDLTNMIKPVKVGKSVYDKESTDY